jgi:predicted nucleic acid-binding protein
LNKKLSGAIDFNKEMTALFQAGQFVFVPFTASDTLEFDADSAVGEMHDRIIAGVARRINATLLTRDTQITNSEVVATAW